MTEDLITTDLDSTEISWDVIHKDPVKNKELVDNYIEDINNKKVNLSKSILLNLLCFETKHRVLTNQYSDISILDNIHDKKTLLIMLKTINPVDIKRYSLDIQSKLVDKLPWCVLLNRIQHFSTKYPLLSHMNDATYKWVLQKWGNTSFLCGYNMLGIMPFRLDILEKMNFEELCRLNYLLLLYDYPGDAIADKILVNIKINLLKGDISNGEMSYVKMKTVIAFWKIASFTVFEGFTNDDILDNSVVLNKYFKGYAL